MTTEAAIGMTTIVEMSTVAAPTVWIPIGEPFNIAPPSDTEDQIDVTHYQSPGRRREFIAGLVDGGEFSVEGNYVPGSDTDLFLIASSGVTRNVRLTYPNGVMQEFEGIRTGYEKEIPVDDRMTFNATFKVSGDVEQSAASAPVNVVKPSIAGIPQVGQTLTVHEGKWGPGGTYTYQWQNEGANISLATNKTYVPVVGDIGDTLTCEVTATNSEGSTMAESAGAIDVIAA